MAKIKIYELAKELNVDNKVVIDMANKVGINVKSHLSAIEESEVDKIKSALEKKNNVKKEEKKFKQKNNELRSGPVIIRREVIVSDEDFNKKSNKNNEKSKNIGFNIQVKSKDYNIVYREKQTKPMSVNELFGIKPKKEEIKKNKVNVNEQSQVQEKVVKKENVVEPKVVLQNNVEM